ncbi:MAG: hypothetical protein RL154_717 [Pseudomonadota bacterium]|jgi:Tfp pilus assembly protein PilF
MNKILEIYDLGVAYFRDNKLEKAAIAFVQTIELEPSFLLAYIDYARILVIIKQYNSAINILQKALQIEPNIIEAHNLLGDAYFALGYFESSLKAYNTAFEIEPNNINALLNLAIYYSAMGEIKTAQEIYQIAFKIDRHNPTILLNYAICLLQSGNLLDGFKFYNARLLLDDHPKPKIPFPIWNGEDIANKKILILGEQGFGDEIQFIRYLPLLKQMGATVSLICKPELKELFENSNVAHTVLNANEDIGVHDYWIFLMSLPKVFKTTLETIPADMPYLKANRQKQEFWLSNLPKDKQLIGIMRRGNSMKIDDTKSFEILFQQDAYFISLDNNFDDKWQDSVLQYNEYIDNFADLCALISCLDLVISVDTAVVHLAGALNKKCIVLLPKVSCCWRWGVAKDTSPWYSSLRLVRQKDIGCWSNLF